MTEGETIENMFMEQPGSLLEFMILAVLTKHAKDMKCEIKEVPGWEFFDSKKFRVSMEIDGVSVCVQSAFDRMSVARREWIARKAANLLDEKLADFPDFRETAFQLEDGIRKLAREKLGIDLSEEED